MKTIFKFFVAAFAVAGLYSCGEENNEGGNAVESEELSVTFDKSVIKASGEDVVTFRAFYKGSEVTSEASFFMVDGSKYEPIGNTFSTTQVGSYKFQAAYDTKGYSDIVTISAISRDIPAAATDDQKNNTSFVRRVFFNQHTGAQCPNCPFMTYFLRKTLTGEYKDKVVLASLRNYSGESGFANVPCPGSWPYLHIDYKETYPYNGSVETMQAKIDEWTAEPAKVGISANSVYYEDGQIIVKVSVKAAYTGEYNVGLWLMQDDYYKVQLVDNSRISLLEGTWEGGNKCSYYYHDNSVRVADSKYLGSHVGYPLGKIEAGKTAEWIFLVNVNLGSEAYSYTDHWWEGQEGGIDLDDLHFASFVTARDGSKYTVVNAIDFKYNEEYRFDYIK